MEEAAVAGAGSDDALPAGLGAGGQWLLSVHGDEVYDVYAARPFADCDPDGAPGLEPISLVCKVISANGRPAVKLSDNPNKATGIASEVERYKKFFGTEDFVKQAVKV